MFPLEICQIIASFCVPKTKHILNHILRIQDKYIWEYKEHLNINDKPNGLLMIKNKEHINLKYVNPDILFWRNPIVHMCVINVQYLYLNTHYRSDIYLDNFRSLKVAILQNCNVYQSTSIQSLYLINSYLLVLYKIKFQELRLKNSTIVYNYIPDISENIIQAKRFYSNNYAYYEKNHRFSYEEISKKSDYYIKNGYNVIKYKIKSKPRILKNKRGKNYSSFYQNIIIESKSFEFIID